MNESCRLCGMPQANGQHMLTSLSEDGDLHVRCRWTTTFDYGTWRGRYFVTVPTETNRIDFSKILNPDDWSDA